MGLRVGLVTEGMSDWLVLEAVIRQIHLEAEFVRLQPDQTLTMGRGNGWRGVQTWCREFGPRLEAFMTGVGPPLDLLVIHADCSIADKLGANRECPPASATATALAGVIDADWLQRAPRPGFVVLALPAMTVDIWVVATLETPPVAPDLIECDPAVEDLLGRDLWQPIRRLRYQDGKIKKQATTYRPFAERVGQNLPLVRARCGQAERFCVDLATVTPIRPV